VKLLLLLLFASSSSCLAAVRFDGIDDALKTEGAKGSDVPFGTPVTKWSFCLWVKRMDTNSSILLHQQHDTLANTVFMLRFNSSATNRLEYRYTTTAGGEQIWSSQPDVGSTVGTWFHLAFVHNNTDASTTRLYVNGADVSGAWTTGTGTDIPQTSYTTWVGKNRGTFTNFFGEIDEMLLFWNAYLNPTEVGWLYKSRLHGFALNIRSRDVSGIPPFPFPNLVCQPFDGWPENTTPAGVFRDIGKYTRYKNDFNGGTVVNWTPTNQPVCIPSRVLSYYPNQ